jgi:hypothetical protein
VNSKQKYAHRFAYEITYGALPSRIKVCHKCDNPPCCNPSHLFAGTQKQNLEDMVAKGRSSRGEARPQAKLTSAQVLEIKRIGKTQPYKKIASQYNVTVSCISSILIGRIWKHV